MTSGWAALPPLWPGSSTTTATRSARRRDRGAGAAPGDDRTRVFVAAGDPGADDAGRVDGKEDGVGDGCVDGCIDGRADSGGDAEGLADEADPEGVQPSPAAPTAIATTTLPRRAAPARSTRSSLPRAVRRFVVPAGYARTTLTERGPGVDRATRWPAQHAAADEAGTEDAAGAAGCAGGAGGRRGHRHRWRRSGHGRRDRQRRA